MPAPDDDRLNWDDAPAPTPDVTPPRAKRVRTGFRLRDHDVVADVVGGTKEGGAWKPLLLVAGSVLLALGLILGVVLLTAPPADEPVALADLGPAPPPPTPRNDHIPGDITPPPPPKPFLPPVPPPPPPPQPLITVPPLPDPTAVGTRLDVAVGPVVPFAHEIQKMVAVGSRGLLVALNRQEVVVFDPKAGKVLAVLKAAEQFTDVSLAADESAVFACDFGGENTDKSQIRPHRVHRYTFATGAAEAVRVKGIAHRIAAVTADRFVLQSLDQWTFGTLNSWPESGSEAVELFRFETHRGRAVAFAPATGQLVLGSASRVQRSARTVADRRVASASDPEFSGPTDPKPFLALATDGEFGYEGKEQFAVRAPAAATRTLPEVVLAAARDVAFGNRGRWFRTDTGEEIGRLPFKPRAIALARDGRTGWVADEKGALRSLELRVGTGKLIAPEAPPTAPPEPAALEGGESFADWKPPAAKSPDLPEPAGTLTKFAEVGSFRALFGRELVAPQVNEKHALVAAVESGVLSIFDGAADGQRVWGPQRGPRGGFGLTGGAFSADGEALFASDGIHMHRLACESKTWRSAEPNVAAVERPFAAPDGNTVLLVRVTLDRSGATARVARTDLVLAAFADERLKEIASARLPENVAGMAYDPVASRLFVTTLDAEKGARNVAAYPLGGKPLAPLWRVAVPTGGKPVMELPRALLGADGRFLFLDKIAYRADTGAKAAEFPEPILAATRDAAIAASGKLYDPATGKEVGKLEHPLVAVLGVGTSGRTVWTFDAANKMIRKYTVGAAGVAVAPPKVDPPKVDPPKVNPPKIVPADWAPPLRKPPAFAAPAGTLTTLTETAKFTANDLAPRWLAVADARGLLAATGVGTALVFDTATGKPVGTPVAANFLSAPRWNPDQTAAFVADTKHLHRFDVAAKTWEKAASTATAVVPLSADVLAVYVGGPGKSEVRVVRWAGSDEPTVLARADVDGRVTGLEFNPFTGLLYAVAQSGTADTVREFALAAEQLVPKRTLELPAATRNLASAPTLNVDGTRLFAKRGVVKLDRAELEFEPLTIQLTALARDLAFSTSRSAYRADTGAVAQELPFLPMALAAAPDGQSVWLYDASRRSYHRFAISAAVAPPKVDPKVNPPVDTWKPVPLVPPNIAVPAGRQTAAKEVALAVLPDVPGVPAFNKVNLFHAPAHDRFLLCESHAGVTVFDATKLQPIGKPYKVAPSYPPSLAPDQSALFVVARDTLHRLDLKTLEWTTRKHATGGLFVAVGGDRLLVVVSVPGEKGQPGHAVQVAKWTADGVTVSLAASRLPGSPLLLRYDPTTTTAVAVGLSPDGQGHFAAPILLATGGPVAAKPGQLPGNFNGGLGIERLPASWDGGRLHAAGLVIRVADGEGLRQMAVGGVQVVAASRDLLFLEDGTARADGKPVAALPPPPLRIAAAVASPDGVSLFTVDSQRKLRRFALGEGAAVAPPKVDPKVNPPKAGGRLELPYAPGTQTVLKELDRIPTAAKDAIELVAADPLGVVALLSTPNFGGFQLYDSVTRKKLPVAEPFPRTYRLLTPPDRSALFAHDGLKKLLYRLNATKTGWEKIELAADTRSVLPLSRDKWIAVADDNRTAASVVVSEMTWGDGTPTVTKTVKPNRWLSAAWVGPSGRLAALDTGSGPGFHLLEFAFGKNELTVTRDHAIKAFLDTARELPASWDGRFLFHPQFELLLDLSGAKVVERKPPAALIAGSRDLLFAGTGEYFTTDGKAAGKFGFAIRGADVTPDGKAVWVMDAAKNDLVKFALTDGK